MEQEACRQASVKGRHWSPDLKSEKKRRFGRAQQFGKGRVVCLKARRKTAWLAVGEWGSAWGWETVRGAQRPTEEQVVFRVQWGAPESAKQESDRI